MNTIDQVDALVLRLIKEGVPKPDSIRQMAFACLEWPYVFGAWGQECKPSNRKRYVSSEHPTVKTKCPALNKGLQCSPSNCKWGVGVRMYDCRGFTAWLLRQFGLDLTGEGATSQYNTAKNWVRQGTIDQMPDCVCCVFRRKPGTKTMEHTGMHVGGGVVVDCSVNVRTVGMSGWTHYAIPVGLYSEEEIPVETVKPTLRKGSEGDLVRELQNQLNDLGYDCGTVDGKFGAKTLVAVKAFQRDHGLDADGVVGRKTWAALEEGQPVQKYKVTCHGMTWDQTQRIREICPTATVDKEE